MAGITILILLFLFIFSYIRVKSMLHPAVVTSGLWFVLLVLYTYLDHGLYALSDKFYYALLLWVIPLCIVSLLVLHTRRPMPTLLSNDVNETTMKWMQPIVFISLIIASIGVIYRGHLYNPENIFHGIRQASIATLKADEFLIALPLWASIFVEITNAIALPFCLYIVLLNKDRKKIVCVVLISLLFLYTLIRSSKTTIAQVAFAFFCLLWYKQKINKRNFLLAVGLIFGIILIPHVLRREDSTDEFIFIEFMNLYLLSPLPAFDSILHQYTLIEDFSGEYTFRAFIKLFQLFDPTIIGNSDPFNLHNWATIPIPTNVYTVMFSFYADFGMLGIAIFSVLYGLFFGILYKRMQEGYTVAILLYACLFYALLFQFFADYIFMFFWPAAFTCITIAIMTINVKFNNQV